VESLEGRMLLSTSAASPQGPLMSPTITSISLGSLVPNGYTPTQVSHAYGFQQIAFNNGTVRGDGSGQTIAIIDAFDDPNIIADLHAFDQTFNLADPPHFTKATPLGQPPYAPLNGWGFETALDVEWAHAMAPGANILLVEAPNAIITNLCGAARWAAQQPGVSVVSMSFGWGEYSGDLSQDANFTTPSGHAGVTFLAASGDNATALYPAASPNVVAVGGTVLTLDAAGNVLGETGWSGSGGGISLYEPKPGFQVGLKIQNGGLTITPSMRAIPDVAYNAGAGFAVCDSWDGPTGAWFALGGTSAGTPQWAALVAIADQGRALRGLPSLDGATQTLPLLYHLPSSAFNDITTGGTKFNSAGPGYDLVTGLGSPIASRVVAGLE
jgi:subtilase family serine protease